MKRAVLLVVILLVCLTPRVDAISYKCVLTNDCKPLPCEFVGELNVARAFARAARRAPSIDLTSTKYDDVDKFLNQRQKATTDIYQKYRKCRLRGPEIPTLDLTNDCRIAYLEDTLGRGRPPDKSLEDVKRDSSTCTEFVEAEYAAAQAEQAVCVVFQGRISIGTLWQSEMLATQARVNSLRAALLRYLRSCKPDAALSRQLAESGLDALAKTGQKARIKWQKAKRAAR